MLHSQCMRGGLFDVDATFMITLPKVVTAGSVYIPGFEETATTPAEGQIVVAEVAEAAGPPLFPTLLPIQFVTGCCKG